MSEDPELVLKRRLAEGAISIDQYRELIAEIRPSVPNATKAFGTSTAPLGRKLAECDDLVVYETGLVFRGRQHPVDSVTSVRGGQSSSSINFVPTEKSTSLSIALVDGDTISLQEQRILFGGSRHKALLQTLATLRQITFKPRLINLVVKLKKQGFIELSRPMFGNGETVTLSVDGTVSAGARSISLKQAKASGTFGVGSERHSLSGSYRSNPNEVIVSEKRGLAGALIPFGALRFTPWIEDPDIVHSLLEWLAEPHNQLQ